MYNYQNAGKNFWGIPDISSSIISPVQIFLQSEIVTE
jgi:hypothetical protein